MKKKKLFNNASLLSNTVFEIARDENIGLIDAIVLYAESNDIEIEALVPLITKNKEFVDALEIEASKLNLIKNTQEKEALKDFNIEDFEEQDEPF